MDEFIKREEALQQCSRFGDYTAWSISDGIGSIPAADVAPVVHGRFIHIGPRFAGGVDWWNCSICGGLASGVETRFIYCPRCGAKMDEKDGEFKDE